MEQISTHLKKACVQKGQVSVTFPVCSPLSISSSNPGCPTFFHKGSQKRILMADLRAASARIPGYSAANIIIMYVLKIKVKLSHYMPGQTLRVPGCCVSQTSRQSPHDGGEVFSHRHWPPLLPQIFLVLILVVDRVAQSV